MSAVAASELTPALAASMEARAINHAEALELFNPDPECNSAVEHLIALCRDYAVPAHRAQLVIDDIRDALELNDTGLTLQDEVSGTLDTLARRAHNAGIRSTMTVREVMDATRPALATLRDAGVTDDAVRAVLALARVFETVDEIRPSLAAQLGAGPYKQLVALRDMWAQTRTEVQA